MDTARDKELDDLTHHPEKSNNGFSLSYLEDLSGGDPVFQIKMTLAFTTFM
ncbi:MAG: hypothetical protein SH818_03530 [Saprospiraceae bacterium]|nr:hypothetical protein [Saprospiraceae bacterium]